MIWASSKQLGCGKAEFEGMRHGQIVFESWIVCRYSPPGNTNGLYPSEVHCPVDGSGVGCGNEEDHIDDEEEEI